MTDIQMITIIASSTVLATLLTTFITFFINKHFKNVDFKNEYYKKVIDKRMLVYESLILLINKFKETVIDEDNLPYHRIYSYDFEYYWENTKSLSDLSSKYI